MFEAVSSKLKDQEAHIVGMELKRLKAIDISIFVKIILNEG